MRTVRAWFSKIAGLFQADRAEQSFAEELESHLDLHIADNLRRGMTPGEARRVALLKLGGRDVTADHAAQSGPYRRGGALAGARHRRQHRDVQHCVRRAVASPALPRSRTSCGCILVEPSQGFPVAPTMGITLRKSRFFDAGDNRAGVPVAMINTAAAQRFFPNEDPIGKLIYLFPPEQLVPPGQFVAVRTHILPSSLISSVRGEVSAMDRNVPIAHVATMEDLAGSSVALPRLQTLLLAVFGTLALALAAVGLYGAIAQSVAQRRHEVGVRIALGARPRAIVGGIVAHSMTLVAIGLLVGCVLALALTRLMATLLFEVTPTDARTFLGAAIVLLTTSAVASYLPARRAASVDPVVTLRCE